MRKTCLCCGKRKRLSQFYYRKKRRQYDASCKLCAAKRRQRGHRANLYGLEPGQLSEMLKAQNHMCAICYSPITRAAAVDHDHETGKVRGLLCNNCNVGLGMFEDNPDLLQQAIDYLCAT